MGEDVVVELKMVVEVGTMETELELVVMFPSSRYAAVRL